VESLTKDGDSPVFLSDVFMQVKHFIVFEFKEAHLLCLNILLRPIVNKYREGKVKRTLDKGVKQILKLETFKQSKNLDGFLAYLLHNGSVSK